MADQEILEDQMSEEEEQLTIKQFKCSYCDYKTKRSHSLKRHERIHTGEKPFSCSKCNKVFSTKGQLKIHELIHTDEKPYKCSLCDYKTVSQSHLKKHERNKHRFVYTDVMY